MAFSFPAETAAFLTDIAKNNERDWFEANRDRYEAGYVEAGRAFVDEMGPRLREISPGVNAVPKINGSISRINRDTRFSKDKTPYKDHLDLWFWHGDKRGWDQPGFYLRVTADKLYLGSGMHVLNKELIVKYRDAVVDERSGKALEAAIAKVEKAGPYNVGGASRKTVPRGYDADHKRAAYLLHEGLYAGLELPFAAATKPAFADVAEGHFRATWPIGRWLLDEVVDG
ncbi:MAG: DUF2461 domain-containing protein [Rhizobiaceae bacterium]|nr:DUF2461 domain-containing protein [Rhizobiaceae bacterium]